MRRKRNGKAPTRDVSNRIETELHRPDEKCTVMEPKGDATTCNGEEGKCEEPIWIGIESLCTEANRAGKERRCWARIRICNERPLSAAEREIMVWIEQYRIANGLELDEFARRVNIVGRKMNPPLRGCVSDTLIYVLERSKSPRTHSRIAAAIATVCRATPEQYDSIVSKAHRGKWEYKDISGDVAKTVPKFVAKSVVKVDDSARIIQRYASAKAAAISNDLSYDTIKSRCERRLKHEFSESTPFTYRYAQEWEKMTKEQRLKDIGVKIDE